MKMLVSGISRRDGKKIAYIRFEDGNSYAEAMIPDCHVTQSEGFTKDEICQLEKYMRDNLEMLKKQAAGINPIKAMMKKGSDDVE